MREDKGLLRVLFSYGPKTALKKRKSNIIILETNTVLMQGKVEYQYLEIFEGSIQNFGLEIIAHILCVIPARRWI